MECLAFLCKDDDQKKRQKIQLLLEDFFFIFRKRFNTSASQWIRLHSSRHLEFLMLIITTAATVTLAQLSQCGLLSCPCRTFSRVKPLIKHWQSFLPKAAAAAFGQANSCGEAPLYSECFASTAMAAPLRALWMCCCGH